MTQHMHTVFGGLKLAGCWLAGMGVGTLADAIAPLGPDTHVNLGVAVGTGVSCLLAAMWLSRRLTQLSDGQKYFKEGLEGLKQGQARMEESFRNLPCHQWPPQPEVCPPLKSKHR